MRWASVGAPADVRSLFHQHDGCLRVLLQTSLSCFASNGRQRMAKTIPPLLDPSQSTLVNRYYRPVLHIRPRFSDCIDQDPDRFASSTFPVDHHHLRPRRSWAPLSYGRHGQGACCINQDATRPGSSIFPRLLPICRSRRHRQTLSTVAYPVPTIVPQSNGASRPSCTDSPKLFPRSGSNIQIAICFQGLTYPRLISNALRIS